MLNNQAVLNDELSSRLEPQAIHPAQLNAPFPPCSIFIGMKIEQQGDELMLSQQGDELMLSQQGDELMLSQRRYTQVVLDRFDTSRVPVPSPSPYASPSQCPPLPASHRPGRAACGRGPAGSTTAETAWHARCARHTRGS